ETIEAVRAGPAQRPARGVREGGGAGDEQQDLELEHRATLLRHPALPCRAQPAAVFLDAAEQQASGAAPASASRSSACASRPVTKAASQRQSSACPSAASIIAGWLCMKWKGMGSRPARTWPMPVRMAPCAPLRLHTRTRAAG